MIKLNWKPYKKPSKQELEWIKSFGKIKKLNKIDEKLSKRVTLEIANLKEATRIIINYHYLHRGRTMAQLPYWILLDNVKIGVLLYAYPRLSVPLFGVEPMNILELARMWISPSVQDKKQKSSEGKYHSFSVASCALGKSLKKIQFDWHKKYSHLPDVKAVVSWADDEHHEGTVYKATNFVAKKKSGGSLHGNAKRNNGGRDQKNKDYLNVKTLWWYEYKSFLTEYQKRHIKIEKNNKQESFQLSLTDSIREAS
mgnify:CR=1 FL=1|tara:strand:- start:605 stop:1366 length:762 start_codon:yes stop_codon:yes gene_type:complete